MPNLRIGKLPNTESIRLTVTITGELHERLNAYCRMLQAEGQTTELRQLVPHMLERFIAGDREFARRRRQSGRDESRGPSDD